MTRGVDCHIYRRCSRGSVTANRCQGVIRFDGVAGNVIGVAVGYEGRVARRAQNDG